jgi:hypothetical protein
VKRRKSVEQATAAEKPRGNQITKECDSKLPRIRTNVNTRFAERESDHDCAPAVYTYAKERELVQSNPLHGRIPFHGRAWNSPLDD